jgi:hypothetical protein
VNLHMTHEQISAGDLRYSDILTIEEIHFLHQIRDEILAADCNDNPVEPDTAQAIVYFAIKLLNVSGSGYGAIYKAFRTYVYGENGDHHPTYY